FDPTLDPNPTMPGSARIRRCSSTESFLPASSSSSLPPIPLPSSHRSVRSTGSAAASGKSPYWQAWSNINKLGSFMVRGSGSSNNNNTTRKDDVTAAATTTSKLTAARLAAHNRREQKYSSPYYKGLTDSSLIISRERGQDDVVVDADVEEDDLEIVVTSASQLPSFVSRMKEWRRRLSFSSKLDGIIDSNNDTFSSALTTAVTPPAAAAVADAKEVDVETEEKPLRERITEDGEDDRLVQSTTALTAADVEKVGVELEFQWANKYRPKALKDFMCNRDKAVQLQSIIKEVNCNHFILQGPAGVGKTTMIWAMLQEAYGPDRVQTKEERMTFKLQGEPIGSIRVKVKASMQHVEVNVSAMKGYEKHIIVELIKKSHQRASSLSSDTSSPSKLDSCQAIVLHEAEKLSADGVVYIKWLLERYKGFSKFFFCCGDDASKLQPITPLCTVVQLSPPSHLEIVEVLEFIAKEEGIELPHELAGRIAGNFKNNLRQAIRSFEACWRKSCQLTEDQVIWTGWEDDIANIAKNIIDEQSPKQ
ncbi:Replication factor C subunit 3, partial [Linum perenne]